MYYIDKDKGTATKAGIMKNCVFYRTNGFVCTTSDLRNMALIADYLRDENPWLTDTDAASAAISYYYDDDSDIFINDNIHNVICKQVAYMLS